MTFVSLQITDLLSLNCVTQNHAAHGSYELISWIIEVRVVTLTFVIILSVGLWSLLKIKKFIRFLFPPHNKLFLRYRVEIAKVSLALLFVTLVMFLMGLDTYLPLLLRKILRVITVFFFSFYVVPYSSLLYRIMNKRSYLLKYLTIMYLGNRQIVQNLLFAFKSLLIMIVLLLVLKDNVVIIYLFIDGGYITLFVAYNCMYKRGSGFKIEPGTPVKTKSLVLFKKKVNALVRSFHSSTPRRGDDDNEFGMKITAIDKTAAEILDQIFGTIKSGDVIERLSQPDTIVSEYNLYQIKTRLSALKKEYRAIPLDVNKTDWKGGMWKDVRRENMKVEHKTLNRFLNKAMENRHSHPNRPAVSLVPKTSYWSIGKGGLSKWSMVATVAAGCSASTTLGLQEYRKFMLKKEPIVTVAPPVQKPTVPAVVATTLETRKPLQLTIVNGIVKVKP